MKLPFDYQSALTRRHFFARTATGIGSAALASLLNRDLFGSTKIDAPTGKGMLGAPHIAPRAKRIIYLFMSGGPSQMDLLDPKPNLRTLQGIDLPNSVRMGQRLTGMTSGQSAFPVASSIFNFQAHGKSGTQISEALPHIGSIADDICVLKTIHTEAINHDPAITFIQTGSQMPGRPSAGAWLSYGLGSDNEDLPSFVVFTSRGSAARDPQSLYSRLWGAGFLPSEFQGVQFRSSGDTVLYLSNPPGINRTGRRRMLDSLAALNQFQLDSLQDPEISARIAQYEMAYRMQSSVPELTDLSDEPESTFRLYGDDARKPGTFAANCLLARRLAERDVKFIQLFHRGWDQHGNLPSDMKLQCKDVDQASAALVTDLKQRGMLDDTLVIWGGEFGRTVYCQGALTDTNYGRDHHPRCFSIWMAGGGVKGGLTYGETDDFSYNIVQNPIHVHDLNATILHCLGVRHEHLTFKYQGRNFRLTDVHGNVVHDILA